MKYVTEGVDSIRLELLQRNNWMTFLLKELRHNSLFSILWNESIHWCRYMRHEPTLYNFWMKIKCSFWFCFSTSILFWDWWREAQGIYSNEKPCSGEQEEEEADAGEEQQDLSRKISTASIRSDTDAAELHFSESWFHREAAVDTARYSFFFLRFMFIGQTCCGSGRICTHFFTFQYILD